MQVEAFFEVARADAGRLALLDDAQAALELFGCLLVRVRELGEVGAEVAVVVEFKGDDECRLALGFAQVGILAEFCSRSQRRGRDGR